MRKLLTCLFTLSVAAAIVSVLWSGSVFGLSDPWDRWLQALLILVTLAGASWSCLRTYGAPTVVRRKKGFHLPPTSLEEYLAEDLGPLPADAGAAELYLDVMKRSLANILYEDVPYNYFDENKKPILAPAFDLHRRVMGEDMPREAHSMIGIRRLENLQYCIEQAIERGVPGDVVEAGVFQGGAAVFARAVLRAHGVTDRKVVACDAFARPQQPLPDHLQPVFYSICKLLGSIPGRAWRRWLFSRLWSGQAFFPATKDEELEDGLIWMLRHPQVLFRRVATGIDNVRSVFARYGLLDEQVVFVKGFFSDTLPTAPIERIAVLRLDADIYESTIQALDGLYHKLSPGGYCIVDDYHAFSACRRAVDEFRNQHQDTAELIPIDNLAVYWQKP